MPLAAIYERNCPPPVFDQEFVPHFFKVPPAVHPSCPPWRSSWVQDGKDSEVLPHVDSGYTSLAESRSTSRYGSRVSSQRNSRASSPIRSSQRNSRASSPIRSSQRNSRASSPIRSSQRNSRASSPIRSSKRSSLASSPIRSSRGGSRVGSRAASPTRSRRFQEADSPSTSDSPQTFVITMPNGRSMPLDHRTAANVLKNVMDDEVSAAREWLDNLDWDSAARYERTQYHCFMMEEEYRRVYDQGAPDPDFDQKTFEELVIADTIISMVEKAWPENESLEPASMDIRPSLSPVRPVQSVRVPAPTRRKSKGKHSSNRSLKVDDSVSSEDDPKNLSDSVSLGAKPMQVHRRSSKPKREDAVFNIRYKTQPCMHFQKHRKCPAGDNCHFAHGPDELRRAQQHPKYKTQPCVHFSKTGDCPFGDACFFLHNPGD